MNVTLIRPHSDNDIADAMRRAGRVAAPYALVAADPLAELARSWQAMWDVAREHDPADFEVEAAKALAAWRTGQFELPDYYLVLAAGDTADAAGAPVGIATDAGTANDTAGHRADFHLGPLRSVRPHRVAVVAAEEPAEQASGVLHALGSLRHGPWWPGLDRIIDTARGFYPDSLAGAQAVVIPSALRRLRDWLTAARTLVQLGVPVVHGPGPGEAGSVDQVASQGHRQPGAVIQPAIFGGIAGHRD